MMAMPTGKGPKGRHKRNAWRREAEDFMHKLNGRKTRETTHSPDDRPEDRQDRHEHAEGGFYIDGE